ncbi:MAG: rna recognition motif domain [Akkermansiaceae bacterium]|nr:rna recognition motif domain [Akkermansiaceae bacterium]
MSNATPDTRGAGGERRRRRSRGGKGRNRNRQDAQGGEQREQREPRQHHGHQHGNAQSRQERQDRGPRPSTYRQEPVKLTLWQKILKAIGLYKEPVRPPRPEREERKPRLNIEEAPAAVKSNVRNARQNPDRQIGERAENDRRRQERPAPPEGGAPSRRTQEKTEVGSPRIYLGNLSYDASEEDLKDLFKGIGTVRRVEVVYNRRTHKSKGYGFVDMLNMEEAKRSVEVLHDQFFMGRKLVVSGAKTKEYEEGQREDEQEAAEAREARKATQAAQAAAAPVAAAPEAEATPAPDAPVAEVAAEHEAPAAIVTEEPAPQLIFEEPEAPHQPHQH